MDEVSRKIEASSDSTSLQDAGGARAPYGPHAAREQGRNGGQQPPPAFGKDEGLLEVLDRACREFEAQPAIETDDGVLTYGGLDAAANRVANCLIENGAAPGSIVAVLLGRPADVITTLVGVLRAGCVFVPLDTDAPEDRLRHILAELAPRFYVLDGDYGRGRGARGRAGARACAVPRARRRRARDRRRGRTLRASGRRLQNTRSRPPVAVDPEAMRHVYYTSGSTGVPKGIACKLKSLTHFIKYEVETFGVASGWRVSQFTTHTFDAFRATCSCRCPWAAWSASRPTVPRCLSATCWCAG